MTSLGNLLMFTTGLQKMFEDMPKTIDKIMKRSRGRHHYQHKVDQRKKRRGR